MTIKSTSCSLAKTDDALADLPGLFDDRLAGQIAMFDDFFRALQDTFSLGHRVVHWLAERHG